jgi:hypothetical protein
MNLMHIAVTAIGLGVTHLAIGAFYAHIVVRPRVDRMSDLDVRMLMVGRSMPLSTPEEVDAVRSVLVLSAVTRWPAMLLGLDGRRAR